MHRRQLSELSWGVGARLLTFGSDLAQGLLSCLGCFAVILLALPLSALLLAGESTWQDYLPAAMRCGVVLLVFGWLRLCLESVLAELCPTCSLDPCSLVWQPGTPGAV